MLCPSSFSNSSLLSVRKYLLLFVYRSYCDDFALVAPSAECDEGYYCEYGVDRARPTGVNVSVVTLGGGGECQISGGMTGVGDVCPIGSFCPQGSTLPLLCSNGTYGNETGLALCHECPAGYYCLEGSPSIFISNLLL